MGFGYICKQCKKLRKKYQWASKHKQKQKHCQQGGLVTCKTPFAFHFAKTESVVMMRGKEEEENSVSKLETLKDGADTMVTHFKQLPEHKHAVLALYRNLLRTLNQKSKSTKSKDNQVTTNSLKYLVKQDFKAHKSTVSSWQCHSKLTEAHKLYNSLQKASYKRISSIVNEILLEKERLQKEKSIRKLPKLRTQLSHNILPSEEYSAQLGSQQRKVLYLKTYFQKQRKLTPEKIDLNDSENQSALKIVLYERALRRYNKIKYQLEVKGPYKVKKVPFVINNQLIIPYLRAPWQQSQSISVIIHKCRVLFQKITSFGKTPPEYLKYARMEGEWEYNLLDINNSLVRERSIKQWTSPFFTEMNAARKKLTRYADFIAKSEPKLLQLKNQYQQRANEIHERRLKRFRKLEKYIEENNIGPNSTPSLNEALKLHQF